jgi:pimeloyl-ACP methyl ester carboxylesterase
MSPAVAPRGNLKRLALFALALAFLWFARDGARHGPPRHQAEWLQADDVMLRVLRDGSGDTTLVLLHGYGESLMAYRATFDQLARKYRVIALDLPGFGLSDKPDRPYDLGSYDRRLSDFLRRWVRGPIVIVGHSMGGEVAAQLALSHPDRIVAVVLISPAGYALAPLVADAAGMPGSTLGWAASAISSAMPPQDPAWLSEPADRTTYDPASDPAYRSAAERVLRDFDFTALKERFGEIRQPTLLLWGRRDPTIPFAVGERIAAELPCRRFVPLDNMLHRPHESNPDTVVSEIERFLTAPSAACGA